MKTSVVYSELFDMFLLLRQIFSNERFRPFNSVTDRISENLSPFQLESIHILGVLTNGYLSALRVLIDSDNLSLADIIENPSILFISEKDEIHDERIFDQFESLYSQYGENEGIKKQTADLLKNLWSDPVCREKANHSRRLLDKIEALRQDLKRFGTLSYLEGISDRFYRDNEYIHFRIKPELKLKICEIENIIIVPSIYATRDLTFWYSGNNLLFFISLSRESGKSYNPSDMHILYTSAINDKTRLKMLRYMSGRNCTAGELAEFLGMNASTISRHLKVFKDAGFVDLYSNEGKQIIYTINRSGIEHAFEKLKSFLMDEE